MNIRPVSSSNDVALLQQLYQTFYPTPVPNIQMVLSAYAVHMAEANGQVVGIRMLSPSNVVWIAIVPDHQRKGLGTLLMNDVIAQSDSKELISRVGDTNTAGLAFCEKYDFKPYLHMVNLELDLTAWDDSALASLLHEATAHGIAFKTYADFGDTPDSRQRLYTLNKALSATIPRAEPQPFADFDTYVERRLLPAPYVHDGIFLAVAGDQWIGMSQVSLHDGYAFNEMTGVLPEYRGQGVAQTLKLLSTRFAKGKGYRVLKTFNDVSNAPMIAVNEKLGFRRGVSFYQLRRTMA